VFSNIEHTICLIIPPSPFLLDERVFMSLGILKVAAALEREGVRVEMVDLSGIENYLEAIEAQAATSPASVFGLTATTPQLPAVRALVERLRDVRPDARIILGGPHVTLVNAARKLEVRRRCRGRGHAAFETLAGLVDVLVAGEGEAAVFDALRPEPPRLVDADDPRRGLFMSDATYDASPFPARHLVDVDSYRSSIEGHPATSLIAQLGCPFGGGGGGGRNSSALRQIRTRTADSIVAEMDMLHHTYGYTGFMFSDDELNVSKGMVALMDRIADLQDGLGVTFHLRGFVKSELFDDAQAAAMYRAGFRWLLVGFEAASERILTNINTRATRGDNTRCIETAHRHGLKVKALMSLGHPGESAETAAELHRWLLEVRPDDFDCAIITPYPGTPYYDEALPHPTLPGVYTYTVPRTGDRLHAFDLDFSHAIADDRDDSSGGYRAFVFTDDLARAELVALRDGIERDVRAKLGIPFKPSRATRRYEHAMGMSGTLPGYIARTTSGAALERELVSV